MKRVLTLLMLLAGLSACTNANDLGEPPVYLGNFQFGHNIVVAPNLTRGPASREATKEEWIDVMTKALDARFSRYEGSKFYNLGVSVEGYVLAIPGIPVVAAPKSALIVRVTVWDDAGAKKLNEEPKVITALESLSGETVVSSGLTQTREQQMQNLSKNAAKLIENWLVEQNNEFGWFEDNGQPAKNKPTAQTVAPTPVDSPPDAEEEPATEPAPLEPLDATVSLPEAETALTSEN
jgi:hypothetical protein